MQKIKQVVLAMLMIVATMLFGACKKEKTTPIALDAPQITLVGDEISWQAVENATAYDVCVGDEVTATVTQTSYTLTITEEGEYLITVIAKGDGKKYTHSKASNAVTYKVEKAGAAKLATPAITLEDDVVRWEAVLNAVSYDVYVNGEAAANVTQTNYALEISEVGEYKIKVVAKGDGENYLDSEPSNEQTYVCAAYFVRIEKLADPTTDTYYVDENSALDLTGLSVNAVYSDGSVKEVALTVENVITEYDLTAAGRYELELVYAGNNNVKSSIVVRINVKERTPSDVQEYLTVVNEYGAEEYQIADFAATSATTMTGDALTLSVKGGKTYVLGDALSEGETFLRVSNGTADTFINMIVARFVQTTDDFYSIEDNMNGYYLLCNDLDFSETTCDPIGRAPILVTDGNKIDLTGVGSEDGALGAAFTGTFNGNGYVIKNFSYTGGNGESWWKPDCYALGLFGYVGKAGCVKNLSLRNVSIKGGDNCSFVAGVNQGSIENVCIEDGCYLFNAYGQGAAISACNYGVVKNVVSYVTQTAYNYGAKVTDINVVKEEAEYTSDVGVNGYIGDTSDLTGILGEGWSYINGYGTVYGNASYKKILSVEKVWYVGENIEVSFWQKTQEEVYFALWGTSAASATEALVYLSHEPSTHTYTLKFADGLNVAANTQLTLGIGISGKGYVELIDVTVGTPYATEYAAPETEITAEQGNDLDLTKIYISVTYSDGSTKQINPLSVEDYDKLGTVGETQTVKLFYGEGENDYVTAQVRLVEGMSSGYELQIETQSDKLSYSATKAVDFSGCTFTLKTPNGDQTLTVSELTVEGVKCGSATVTFTYENGDVTARVSYTFEIWYTITIASEWSMMNENLSGYYELGDDLDLQGATYSEVIGKAPLISATEGYEIDQTGVGDTAIQSGVAFTGKFNGNGYKVSNFASAYAGAPYLANAYALVPFAYVGVGGSVENFTLVGADIKCGQNGSFLVGLNLGTVKDVTIESDCSLFVNYSRTSPYAAVINGGTVSGIVCKATNFVGWNSGTYEITDAVYQTVGNGTATDCTLGTQS